MSPLECGIFVAVGWDADTGTNIYHSTDGIHWTPHQTAIGNFYRVAYGRGIFVAVGDDDLVGWGGGTTNCNIYTSPDGTTWTARNSGAPANDVQPITDVAYGAGRFVAVDGAYHFYTSTSGSSWIRTTSSSAGSHISYCNDHFIVPTGSEPTWYPPTE